MTQGRFSPGRRGTAEFVRSSRPAFCWEEAARSSITVSVVRHSSCSSEEGERVTRIGPNVSNGIGAAPIREPCQFELSGPDLALHSSDKVTLEQEFATSSLSTWETKAGLWDFSRLF
jgi:hypothetical protein